MNIHSAITPVDPVTSPRTTTPVEHEETWYDRAKKAPMICHRLRNEFVKWYQLAWRERMETTKLTKKFLMEATQEGWELPDIRKCLCHEDFLKVLREKDPRYQEVIKDIENSCNVVEDPSKTLDLFA